MLYAWLVSGPAGTRQGCVLSSISYPASINDMMLELKGLIIYNLILGSHAVADDMLLSKMISNDQELIQSDPTSCSQNQKGNN